MRIARTALLGAVSVATIALVATAALLIALRVAGYSAAVVTGGSMEPAVGRGSLILVEPVAQSAITLGEVITYSLPDRLITHRVVAVRYDELGLLLVTKGDANEAADPGGIRANGAVGAVRLTIPLAGYVLLALQAWWRALALVALAGLGIVELRRRVVRRVPQAAAGTA